MNNLKEAILFLCADY